MGFLVVLALLFNGTGHYVLGSEINSTLPITLFYNAPVLQSPSTQQILQKYYTQSNDAITVFVINPQNFKVQNTLIPKFPNQQKVIVTTSIPNIQTAISTIGPILTKGRDAIKYDPEVWSYTPPTEYDDTIPGGQTIAQSISQAADLVHGAGLLFDVAPQSRGGSKPSPSLFQHYQEIDWTKVDHLSIQMQSVLGSTDYMSMEKQIYQFVKTKSPHTQVFVNIGLVPGTKYNPDQIVTFLEDLKPNYDGIGILYITGPTCNVCSDDNLEKLLGLIRGSSPTISTEYYKIPQWVRHNAQWWADDEIGDEDFLKGIEYLINQGIIVIPAPQPTGGTSHVIPIWIKNDARWWANNEIGDEDFVKAMQFLVANNIIHVSIGPASNTIYS